MSIDLVLVFLPLNLNKYFSSGNTTKVRDHFQISLQILDIKFLFYNSFYDDFRGKRS